LRDFGYLVETETETETLLSQLIFQGPSVMISRKSIISVLPEFTWAFKTLRHFGRRVINHKGPFELCFLLEIRIIILVFSDFKSLLSFIIIMRLVLILTSILQSNSALHQSR
jgi:hypothetical protein